MYCCVLQSLVGTSLCGNHGLLQSILYYICFLNYVETMATRDVMNKQHKPKHSWDHSQEWLWTLLILLLYTRQPFLWLSSHLNLF